MSSCFINNFGEEICQSSNWFYWGRWVILGAAILIVLATYIIFARLSSRRRHRAGATPYMGTQWALGRNPPQYNSTETLPKYAASYNNSNSPFGNVNRDIEGHRAPNAAHVPAA